MIEDPQGERGKKQYAKWQAEEAGKPTWRTMIRQDIEEAVSQCVTWTQFVRVLERKGYEIRMGRKYPTLRPPGKERFVRFKTLGKQYTPEAIKQRILYSQKTYPAEPHVRHVRLHGTYRNQGYMQTLFRFLCDTYLNCSFRICTYEKNAAMIQCIKNSGFQEEHRVVNDRIDGTNTIYYVRKDAVTSGTEHYYALHGNQ